MYASGSSVALGIQNIQYPEYATPTARTTEIAAMAFFAFGDHGAGVPPFARRRCPAMIR